VQNPTTKDLGALDALLTSGPARYVDSAKLGEAGTMIIFAHSSHLPIVHNKMYQAFNKIPDLKAGDSITLTGEDGVRYLYSVSRVYKADAESTSIDMSPSLGTRLVLVTCDTLTGKSARFVLEASLVGTI
jgi:sortase (surface protein transpeptidase)